jgi:uncharacterized protein YecT (DUF1311 family)
MSRLLLFLLIALSLFLSSGGRARAQSQPEMNSAAAADAARADKALTAVYQKLRDSLQDDANAQQALDLAEKAWLDYRDQEAAFEASPNLGGSIYPLTVSTITQRLTQERIAYLQNILKNGLDSP